MWGDGFSLVYRCLRMNARCMVPKSRLSPTTERRWSNVSLSRAARGGILEHGCHQGSPARLSRRASARQWKGRPRGRPFAFRGGIPRCPKVPTALGNSRESNALSARRRGATADNKTDTGSPDRDRISLSEDYEIRDWTESLGVFPSWALLPREAASSRPFSATRQPQACRSQDSVYPHLQPRCRA